MTEGRRLVVLTAAWPSRRFPTTGGFIRTLTQSMRSCGLTMHVVAPGAGRGGAEGAVVRFAQVLGRPKLRPVSPVGGVLYLLGAARAVISVVRRTAPEALLVHWALPGGPSARLVAAAYGLPLLVWVHGSDLAVYGKKSRFFRILASYVLRGARLVLAVNRSLAEEAARCGAQAVEVLPMGVDRAFCGAFAPREAFPFRAVFLGDFIPAKGVRSILTAARLLGRTRQIEFCFAGSGPLEGEIRRAGHRVVCNAPRGVVRRLLDEAHVLLLPSRSEGMPLSVLEALKRGTPVVATSVGGIPQCVRHLREGVLLPLRGTSRRLAEALARLYDDRTLWQSLHAACKARAASIPTSETVAQRFCALLARRVFRPCSSAALPEGGRRGL